MEIVNKIVSELITKFNTDDLALVNTLKFWANNSYEHIDVLQNAYKTVGATLQPSFATELTELFTKFKNIDDAITYNKLPNDFDILCEEFEKCNRRFVYLLEKLKFEGYNGYPVLFETVQHFIYEQLYAKQVLDAGYKAKADKHYTQNMFTTSLNSKVTTLKGCMYFWSLIGAEHTSIIATVSPVEDKLPKLTLSLLANFRTIFNQINYILVEQDDVMSDDDLNQLAIYFIETNEQFLKLLNNFKQDNSELLPSYIKKELPPLFEGVLNHIIHEHERVLELMKSLQDK